MVPSLRRYNSVLACVREDLKQGPFYLGYPLDDSTHVPCQRLYCTLHDPKRSRERLFTALLLRYIEGHHLCDVGIS